MNISVYSLVVEQFTRSLEALNGLLAQAEKFAKERNFDANSFLELRLAPDMFNLARQIQICTDISKGAIARLTGKQAPSFEDGKTTFEELRVRIGKTIEFIQSAKSEEFSGFEQKMITFPWYPGKGLEGLDYVTSFALPNFYFHLTTTYNLLRGHGVELGKAHYLGKMNWKDV